MFEFYKEFEVRITIDCVGSQDDIDERASMADKDIHDIMKHFGIGYSTMKKKFIEYPPKMLQRGNVVKFGGKCAMVLSWKCFTTQEGYERFKNEINDYHKEPYPRFRVYESLC